MNLSAEAKVGAVALLAFLLLGGTALFYGTIHFGEEGYHLFIDFERVEGLREGAAVRYSGVQVGKVTGLSVLNDGKIRVATLIQRWVGIPEGSSFSIGADGLLGDKFVSITPPPGVSRGMLKEGDISQGQSPQGLDALVSSADKLVLRIDKLVSSFEEVFGDAQVKTSMKETTHNIAVLTATLARVTAGNEGNINAIAQNLATISENLRDAAARVDKMTTTLEGDGSFARDVAETARNLKITSGRIEKMAAALEPVATDPETAKNLKTTLKNAKEASEKANRILGKFGTIKTEAGIDVMYSGGQDRYRENFDLRVYSNPNNFAAIGVSDIGETNRFNLQLGRDSGGFGQRFGLIEGKVGAGIDLGAGRDFKISADAYDPNDVKVKLRSEIKLAPNTYLVGESMNINKESQRSSYMGIRRTF